MVNLTIELLKSVLLTDFPSGSSINYYNDTLYLIGDDANHLLMLDKNYVRVGALELFDFPDGRIPKSEKTDLETSTIISLDGVDHLLVLGSASKKKRRKGILMPLDAEGMHKMQAHIFSYDTFIQRLKTAGIKEVNIEGSTVIGDNLVLSNRGNRANPENHLIVTSNHFWTQQEHVPFFITEFLVDHPDVPTISELCYLPSGDLLLVLLTCEKTDNAYDDGAIGESYLGWVSQASHKDLSISLKPDGIVKLSDISREFAGEKVEGLCVERIHDHIVTLHLIADNDTGESRLFHVKLELN